MRGLANSSNLGLADGSAVTIPGSTSVGAAVAINVGETANQASVAGATITADGITVEAVMRDNKVELTAPELQTLDVAADTILVEESPDLRPASR